MFYCVSTPVYENTDMSTRFLLSDAPFSLRSHILHYNDTVWPIFSHLESGVLEGVSQRDKALSQTSKDQVIISMFRWIKCGERHTLQILFLLFHYVICFYLKDTLHSSQDSKLRFMNAMHNIAKVTGKAIATAFDLSSFRTACDLGGKERHLRFKMMSLSNKPFLYKT